MTPESNGPRCRACSIEAAGCTVQKVATSDAFDCHAAYNNFFRAWWGWGGWGDGGMGGKPYEIWQEFDQNKPDFVMALIQMLLVLVEMMKNEFWTIQILKQIQMDRVKVRSFSRSPSKKKWCCTIKRMGCEGESPPSVDPGVGMMWKHVQVDLGWGWSEGYAENGSLDRYHPDSGHDVFGASLTSPLWKPCVL